MSLKEGKKQRPPRSPGWSCFFRCFSASPVLHDHDEEPVSAQPVVDTRGRRQQEEKVLHKHGKPRSRRQPKQQVIQLNSGTQSQTPAMITRPVPAMIVTEPVVSITTGTTTLQSKTAEAVMSEPKTPMPAAAAARDGHLEPAVGLWVLSVTLVAMLLCGRVFAVFCLCACLYLVPLTAAAREMKRKNSIDLDMNSEEYKKKVILQGLLQRDRRRLC